MDIKQKLQQVIEGEVETADDVLKEYSRDASLFEVRPRVVVYPKHTQDVQALVRFVAEHQEEKLSLVCRSGGTDMTGGPLGESIVVDMARYFNQVKKVGNGYAVVQPGVFYRDFEKQTLQHNQIMPSYPASREICTVGGMVANNAGGEKTLHYGKTADYVQKLQVVLADGNEYTIQPLSEKELQEKVLQGGFEGQLYEHIERLVLNNKELLQQAKPKVSKNSSGYALWNVWNNALFDLTQLLVGSQGTLGIITEITFRLVEPKKHSALLVIFLYDLAPLATLTNTLLKHKPESLESYDDNTLKFAMVHIPDFIKLLKGNIITLGFQFIPEFFMFLKGGFKLPKLVVLAEFTGDSEKEIYQKARTAYHDIAPLAVQARIARSDREELKYMTIRRESFNLLRHHIQGKRTAPFIDDIIVQPKHLPSFLVELNTVLKQYPELVYTVAGHVGNGNFHIIPLMDLENSKNVEIIPKLQKQVHELVFRYEGSMSAEHNDGLIRSPFVVDMFGEKVYDLFVQTKKTFDPEGIFNPGKKVESSLDYALSHIATHNKP
jgi:FAD/FMN-containing dehydrogenase